MEHILIKYRLIRPYSGEHIVRVKDPKQYSKFVRTDNKFGDGIHVIYGVKVKDKKEVSEPQSIRFDASKWTVRESKKWLRDHNWQNVKFEPASDKKVFEGLLNKLSI